MAGAAAFIVAGPKLALVFEGVAERHMGDIMKQCGKADDLGFVGAYLPLRIGVGVYGFQDAAGQMAAPDGMFEAGVEGGWVNQIGRTQLFDAPQALELRRIDDLNFQRRESYIAVNGIPKS